MQSLLDDNLHNIELGADDYLVKPFAVRDLLMRVAVRIQRATLTKKERALREEAELSSAAKDRFLAVLSHELRTPLTPALMLAEAGKLDSTLPANVREDFGAIAANIRLEVQLIGDLLDVTRIRYVPFFGTIHSNDMLLLLLLLLSLLSLLSVLPIIFLGNPGKANLSCTSSRTWTSTSSCVALRFSSSPRYARRSSRLSCASRCARPRWMATPRASSKCFGI